MKPNYDAVVIGGGIIGSALTYYLTMKKMKVCLLEKGGLASGTTGSTMGNLSLHNRLPGPWFTLAIETWKLFSQLQEETGCDCEFEIVSSIMLIANEQNIDWARNRVEVQKKAGLNVELVTKSHLRELDPDVSTAAAAAVYSPLSARVNPFGLCRAYTLSAERGGASIQTHTGVIGFGLSGNRITEIRTNRGRLSAGIVVNAAGAWSGEVGSLAGVDIAVRKNVGNIIVVETGPMRGIAIKGECTDGVSSIDNRRGEQREYDVHFVITRTRSGNCLIGRSGAAGGQEIVQFGAVRAIVQRALRFVPTLRNMKVIRCFAGTRPFSSDDLPILGPVSALDNFYLACGFGDKGIGSGAQGAKILSTAIAEQDPGIIPPEFLPARLHL